MRSKILSLASKRIPKPANSWRRQEDWYCNKFSFYIGTQQQGPRYNNCNKNGIWTARSLKISTFSQLNTQRAGHWKCMSARRGRASVQRQRNQSQLVARTELTYEALNYCCVCNLVRKKQYKASEAKAHASLGMHVRVTLAARSSK